MLDFVIFAVTFIVLMLGLVIYLYPAFKKSTTVPGLDPSDQKEGNFPDIYQAQSFSNFLSTLHQKFGPIASFWLFGPSLTVSLSSEELIQSQDHLFEKPSELFRLYEPFVGGKSILFAQRSDARKQREIWDTTFDQKVCLGLAEVIDKAINELVTKWSSIPEDQHIPIAQYVKAFTLKICLIIGFGDYFANDNSKIIDFSCNYEICLKQLELRARNLSETDAIRNKHFEEAVENLRKMIDLALESRDKNCLAAFFLENTDDNLVLDELMTFILKHNALSSALFWAFYYISSDVHIQEDIVNGKIGIDQVIDAVLETSNVEPWTARVNNDVDIEVAGHIIPKETPLIFNLAAQDANQIESFKKQLKNQSKPRKLFFGSLKSKRSCPAHFYCRLILKLFLTKILRNFQLNLVDADFAVRPICLINSRSEEEVWITVKKK